MGVYHSFEKMRPQLFFFLKKTISSLVTDSTVLIPYWRGVLLRGVSTNRSFTVYVTFTNICNVFVQFNVFLIATFN